MALANDVNLQLIERTLKGVLASLYKGNQLDIHCEFGEHIEVIGELAIHQHLFIHYILHNCTICFGCKHTTHEEFRKKRKQEIVEIPKNLWNLYTRMYVKLWRLTIKLCKFNVVSEVVAIRLLCNHIVIIEHSHLALNTV